MEDVRKWLGDNGSGSGYGYGYGSGDGYGYGDGDGYGYGSGSGYGYGDGYGSGSGDGYGISEFNYKTVYLIDGVPTIIEHIKETFAKGLILNKDFTLQSCFLAKGNGYFAHGKTLKEARESLTAKIFENMDAEETIEAFMGKFKKGEKYPGTEFFEWHHYLTGSCLMGRESFVKNRGIDVNAMYTVDEFIEICENDYGHKVISVLKERWNEV